MSFLRVEVSYQSTADAVRLDKPSATVRLAEF